MNKSLFLVFASLFLLTLVSAKGLVITDNSYDFTKTYGEDKLIEITLENTEDFTFYNIQSDDESKLVFSEFDLDANSNITFNATVLIDSDFDGTIGIIGEYYTNIGSSNTTYEVDVSYAGGINPCNLELIKGDSINWTNIDSSKVIKLTNSDTDSLIYELQPSESHFETFDSTQEFNYYAEWLGISFTNICNVNVLDDSGLVHSNNYDSEVDLNIEIEYPETSLELTFLETDYEIEFNENQEDIFSIRNNGVNLAIISLDADWISFTKNNFELQPGQSTNVGYTIQPLVSSTAETNITHQKNITITGNFDDLVQPINIFVPYQRISTEFYNGSVNMEAMRSLFNAWCNMYPEECIKYTVVIGNNSNSNISVDSNTLIQLLEQYGITTQELVNLNNQIQEKDSEDSDWKNNLSTTVISLTNEIGNSNINSEKSIDNTFLIVLIVVVSVIILLLGFIYTKVIRKKIVENRLGTAEGEEL